MRIVFLSEFLVAVIAIFTAWSEIGGQAVLDAMPWAWKGGFGLGLAGACVAYSAALISADSVWNARTAKWLALILVLVGAMGVVTFYYGLQVQNAPPDEQDNSATGLRSNSISPSSLWPASRQAECLPYLACKWLIQRGGAGAFACVVDLGRLLPQAPAPPIRPHRKFV